MKKKTKKKARLNLTFLKSKKFYLLIAIVIATIALVSYFTFAGSGDNQGRYFSWKQGKVMNDYQVHQNAPRVTDDYSVTVSGKVCRPTYTLEADKKVLSGGTLKCASQQEIAKSRYKRYLSKLQYVKYTQADWNGNYMAVYTEPTNPALGSRDLTPNMVGEDVAALKKAVIYIGELPIYKTDKTTSKIKEQFPVFGKINTDKLYLFDQSLVDALKAFDTIQNGSSYRGYLNDNKLNKYEVVRLFSMATDPGMNTDKAVTFNPSSLLLNGSGKVYSVKSTDKNKWQLMLGLHSYLPVTAYFVPKTNPVYGSRVMEKGHSGGDVKLLQSVLKFVEKKHAGAMKFDQLKVNGIYDEATVAAVKTFQTYYQMQNQNGSADKATLIKLGGNITWPVYSNK